MSDESDLGQNLSLDRPTGQERIEALEKRLAEDRELFLKRQEEKARQQQLLENGLVVTKHRPLNIKENYPEEG